MDVILLAIELKNAAVELLASRFKGLAKLSNHVAVEHLTAIFRREDEVNNQPRNAVASSSITLLHTHLRFPVTAANL